jgi:hypothetical protein
VIGKEFIKAAIMMCGATAQCIARQMEGFAGIRTATQRKNLIMSLLVIALIGKHFTAD